MGETTKEKKARLKKNKAAQEIWKKTVEDARNASIKECPDAHRHPFFVLGREHTPKEIKCSKRCIDKIKAAGKLLQESTTY